MSERRGIARGRASDLRQQFDRSFAVPPPKAVQEVEDLLAIRVAGAGYAIRARDITGIVSGRKLVSVPALTPDFLGLSGIRGGIVPVFGLASILGHGQTADPPRWMVLCGADAPLALGFSDLEGYLRLPKSALHTDEKLEGARKYLEAVASTDTGLRAVIGISEIVATIRNRAGHNRLAKGQ